MKRTVTTLIVAITLLGTGSRSLLTAAALPITRSPEPMQTVNVQSAQAAVPRDRMTSEVDPAAVLMEWARTRFEAAGLTLPEQVDLVLYETQEMCGGNIAVFRGSSIGGEIDLCLKRDASAAAFRRTLLHELAHAWVARNLSPKEMQEFLIMRELKYWGEPAPWNLRGTEHAAEIIAWGLFDLEIGVAGVYPNDTASLTEAFRFLTGREPIHGRENQV